MRERAGNKTRLGVQVAVCALVIVMGAQAQNRGVYPLGMSATNSGITPGAGFTYVNQLLFYSRDHAKDDAGQTLPVLGENYVLMDMNTFAWVSKKKLLGGASFSAVATLPIEKNNLTSDIKGQVSGGRLQTHTICPSSWVGIAIDLPFAPCTDSSPRADCAGASDNVGSATGHTPCPQDRRSI
jgi:hypothetical protein